MIPTRTQRAVTLVKSIAYEIRTEKITFMAASIAYHAFISLFPLLLLLLAVISTVGNLSLKQGFMELAQTMLTPGASEVLIGELRRASASTGISIASIGFFLWGTLRIFRGLDTAFSDIYASQARNTLVDQFVDALVVLTTVTAIIVVTIVVEWKASMLPVGDFDWPLRRLVFVGGLPFMFLPMYYVFPDVDDLSILEVLPGVLIATVGVTTLESLFQFYISFSSKSPNQSIVTAFLVLLTWLYLSGVVILLGAVVNAVTANRSQNVNVRPLINGVPFKEQVPESDIEELLATLDKLDDGTTRPEGIVLDIDGEDVVLPSADISRVETGESGVLHGSGLVGVEFYWSLQEQRDERPDDMKDIFKRS
ncbi:YihY/virulence factor BrkB family protein [Haladaptatus sp. NG-SE-30]